MFVMLINSQLFKNANTFAVKLFLMKNIRTDKIIFSLLSVYYIQINNEHMVKDQSDNERGNPFLPCHGLFFQLTAIMATSHKQDRMHYYLCIFRSNQWSTTGLSKAVVCTVLSMEKCI